jgi:hypothetical protein
LVEGAERMYRDSQNADYELETLLAGKATEANLGSHPHNRRPSQPVKWMKLIQWWLVHRVRCSLTFHPSAGRLESDTKVRYFIWP